MSVTIASKKIVKASFSGCPVSERKLFKDSSCTLLISVGQKYHEGEKLAATIELINRKFKTCRFDIVDSLHRYNMQVFSKESLETLHKMANDVGTAWLDRNQQIINELTIPYEIIRWDYWLSLSSYPSWKEKLDNIYIKDELLRESIDLTIKNYLKRQGRVKLGVDLSKYYESSIEYLKEELAVMFLRAEQDFFEFEVYPNKRNEAMNYIFKNFITNICPNRLKPVSLRFKKFIC